MFYIMVEIGVIGTYQGNVVMDGEVDSQHSDLRGGVVVDQIEIELLDLADGLGREE